MPSDKDIQKENGEDNRPLLSNLPDEISDLLRVMPEEQQQEFLIRIAASFFSGPIPPPEAFEKYKKIQPDFPERIMGMAEKEQKARIDGSGRNDRIEIRKVNGAIFLGFAVIAVSAVATINGNLAIAIPLGTIGIISSIIQAVLRKKESS